MTTAPPLDFLWDGEAMRPRNGRAADKAYVIGQQYRLVEEFERSPNSHNHYFAQLHEAWQNLPERIALEFPTEQHLRKRLLIDAGYRDERSVVCASKAEAVRLAAFIKPLDDFAVVSVNQSAVVVWTAKSQSRRAMSREEFQKSKDDVLALAWQMVGGEPDA